MAARANVEKARATVSDTKQKYDRAKELSAQQLLPESDLETAKSTYQGAVASIQGAEAAVSQAAAAVQQSQVDLTTYAGSLETIHLRFELGVDGCNGSDGWYVDNVRVCGNCAGAINTLNTAPNSSAFFQSG